MSGLSRKSVVMPSVIDVMTISLMVDSVVMMWTGLVQPHFWAAGYLTARIMCYMFYSSFIELFPPPPICWFISICEKDKNNFLGVVLLRRTQRSLTKLILNKCPKRVHKIINNINAPAPFWHPAISWCLISLASYGLVTASCISAFSFHSSMLL